MRLRHLTPLLLVPLLAVPLAVGASATPAAPLMPNGRPIPANGAGPAVTRPVTRVVKVDQASQQGIPKDKRIATLEITAQPLPKAARANAPAMNIGCAPYPYGYEDKVGAKNIIGITLIEYVQDVYFCWSYDTDMLYGVPTVVSWHQTQLGWGFDAESADRDFEPYPYVFHSWRMAQFSFGYDKYSYHQTYGLDAFAYWSGSFHLGPHNGLL